ncbi:MAG: hypothetical protein ACI4KF_02045 [Huintestinicola sp.]
MDLNILHNRITTQYKMIYKNLIDASDPMIAAVRYYVGSHDSLGYYEPDLTDYINEPAGRKGMFVHEKPPFGAYFEYSYTDKNELIRVNYHAANGGTDYTAIVLDAGVRKIFLFYDKENFERRMILSHFYICEYDKSGNMSALVKFFARGSGKYEVSTARYKFIGSRLASAVVTESGMTAKMRFKYNSAGYMCGYSLDDGHGCYDCSADINIAATYERFGMYHFSPPSGRKIIMY